ncbi:MAG: efflux RND transporter periplasmic adaptor subunit [Proteobacteria bacterium]|nr:efflux RND transporter periplasmic adaptor subunit [Pseudomonadota bacterium]
MKLCKLLAIALWAAQTPLAVAQTVDLASIELDCLIEPHSLVKLGSAVTGVLDSVAVDRGDVVYAGQLVARLKSGVEEATVALARARAENDVVVRSRRARLEFESDKEERTETLFKKKIVSGEQMKVATTERRLAELDVSEAEKNQALAKLELRQAVAVLDQRKIVSPVDGVVTERVLSPGEYVFEQSYVFTVAEIDSLHVEVYAPIEIFGAVRLGMKAEVRPEQPVGGTHIAKVTIVDHIIDPASGTFGVRLELPNPDRALPAGLRCKIIFLAE